MRVKVYDYTGPVANRPEPGALIYDMISPTIERGEVAELDFEGVKEMGPLFLAQAVCRLIPVGRPDHVDKLLRATNLSPFYQAWVHEVLEAHKKVKASQEAYDSWQRYLAWMRWEKAFEEGDRPLPMPPELP